MNKVDSAVKRAVGGKVLGPAYVPFDTYVANTKEMVERLHRMEQRTSKARIRKIAEAAYQKQEQRLNTLRDECVRVLSLMRDKGIVTQEEINQAVRDD